MQLFRLFITLVCMFTADSSWANPPKAPLYIEPYTRFFIKKNFSDSLIMHFANRFFAELPLTYDGTGIFKIKPYSFRYNMEPGIYYNEKSNTYLRTHNPGPDLMIAEKETEIAIHLFDYSDSYYVVEFQRRCGDVIKTSKVYKEFFHFMKDLFQATSKIDQPQLQDQISNSSEVQPDIKSNL